MTDFVRRVMRPEHPDWIIRSLLDVDFYKFTMGYYIWQYHRGTEVTFKLINRNRRIPLARLIDEGELRAQLDHVRMLTLRKTDIAYLRGQDVYGKNMFSEDYLTFLGELKLPPYTLKRVGDQYELRFIGPWETVTFWETIALAIICELLYRKLLSQMSETELKVCYSRAIDKIYRKFLLLKTRPSIRFADFGQRRRHSFLWQQFVIEMAREVMGEQFTGTSNTWMAFNQDLTPIGTNAHELVMALVALAPRERRVDAQYDVLREWEKLFPMGGLRIALPDTYGTIQFFENMPRDLAEHVAQNWRGFRLDSGDPVAEAEQVDRWYYSFGIDPMREGKVVIPSDGLDVPEMFRIDDALGTNISHPYGWGTMLTNDLIGCHPRANEPAVIDGVSFDLAWDELMRGHSIVCKIETVNGQPAVKLSNNILKATGNRDVVEEYKRDFGYHETFSQQPLV